MPLMDLSSDACKVTSSPLYNGSIPRLVFSIPLASGTALPLSPLRAIIEFYVHSHSLFCAPDSTHGWQREDSFIKCFCRVGETMQREQYRPCMHAAHLPSSSFLLMPTHTSDNYQQCLPVNLCAQGLGTSAVCQGMCMDATVAGGGYDHRLTGLSRPSQDL